MMSATLFCHEEYFKVKIRKQHNTDNGEEFIVLHLESGEDEVSLHLISRDRLIILSNTITEFLKNEGSD